MTIERDKLEVSIQADMEVFLNGGGKVQEFGEDSSHNKDSKLKLRMKPKDGRLYYEGNTKVYADFSVRKTK